MATLKPTTPLHTAKQQPLKPTTPMQPKNAPKTPISHLQRRRRFQLRLDQHPQRQCRFQSRLGRRPQRRWRFQTTGPPGRQSLTTAPAGGGWAWSGDRWADDVTNVVKPTRFKSPREDLCYKRRQSASKNLDFQRKSRRIDDVCNNTQRSAPKSQYDKPDHIGGPEGLAAAAGPGRASSRRASTRQHTKPHWCEGRRRDRRARLRCPWAAAGPGQASRRRTERSSRRGRRAGGPPPTGTQSSPAPQAGPPAPGTPVGPHSNTTRAYKNAHPEPGGRI